MIASDVITRVRYQLIDTEQPYRWSDTELYLWLTDAARAVAAAVPDSVSTIVSGVPLVAGPRQSLPSGSFRLLSAHACGLVADVPASGPYGPSVRPLRLAERDQVDAFLSGWHTRVGQPDTVLYDPQASKTYWVSPAPAASDQFAAVLTVATWTPDLTGPSDVVGLDLRWLDALVDFVLYRAHSKESDFAGGLALSQAYFERFKSHVQTTDAADLLANPNVAMGSFDPSIKAAAR